MEQTFCLPPNIKMPVFSNRILNPDNWSACGEAPQYQAIIHPFITNVKRGSLSVGVDHVVLWFLDRVYQLPMTTTSGLETPKNKSYIHVNMISSANKFQLRYVILGFTAYLNTSAVFLFALRCVWFDKLDIEIFTSLTTLAVTFPDLVWPKDSKRLRQT